MKYINEERFLVTARDPGAQKNYADNWDKIFGEKKDVTEEAAKAALERSITADTSGAFPVDGAPETIKCEIELTPAEIDALADAIDVLDETDGSPHWGGMTTTEADQQRKLATDAIQRLITVG